MHKKKSDSQLLFSCSRAADAWEADPHIPRPCPVSILPAELGFSRVELYNQTIVLVVSLPAASNSWKGRACVADEPRLAFPSAPQLVKLSMHRPAMHRCISGDVVCQFLVSNIDHRVPYRDIMLFWLDEWWSPQIQLIPWMKCPRKCPLAPLSLALSQRLPVANQNHQPWHDFEKQSVIQDKGIGLFASQVPAITSECNCSSSENQPFP